MNNHILNNLRSLSKKRGDTSSFANYDEFLPWSDDVSPLLEFDDALCKKFEFWSDHVKSAYNMGRETHHEALGECIGVVNQAIKKLEIPTADIELDKPQSKEIEYPNKVTLKWLYHHVPWTFWAWIIGLLLSAFSLGVAVSETEFYKTLKSDSSKQTSVSKKT
ncbi:hypothetical protein [Colwellia sp. TT2012]|uniref:hypothetical protein n=1 Tax=Colwellia sp. TT2012 TaxID=1720342 RepID=UPI00070D71E8|nr:hypothetical protein [Colwellia sp. TT2012]